LIRVDTGLRKRIPVFSGMMLARNVGDPSLADDFRRTAHAEVLRTAG